MNNYLQEVWKNLTGIPRDDAQELLEYWEEFFLDADLSLEEVVSKYGKPRKFAQVLKMSYFLEQDDLADESHQPQTTKSRLRLIWMIILGIFATPVLLPLALVVVMLILAGLLVLFSVLFTCYVVVASLIFGGILSAVTGFGLIFSSFSTMLVFVGLGFALGGFGLLLLPLVVKLTYLFGHFFMMIVKNIARRITRKSNLSLKGEF